MNEDIDRLRPRSHLGLVWVNQVLPLALPAAVPVASGQWHSLCNPQRQRGSQIRVHPMFGGDSNEGDEVRRFHPEGMPAISRGLSVRDTPGTTAQKGDLHPEGMLASSECLPISRGYTSRGTK